MKCPKPTQDSELNLANQKKAMDKVGYGPENPSGEDEKFWEAKAREWDLPIEEAKSRRCGNCGVYNQSSDMMGCITKGMGDDVKDKVENKEIGYCESLNFMCSSKRTCDAWAPRKKEEKAGMFDLYLKKVDEFLTVLEVKDVDAAGTYEIDVETKVRKVKDSAYWGRPVGTPIVPGMKPEGPKSPMGRARRAASGGDGGKKPAKPKKRIKPSRSKKPSKPAGSDRSEIAGSERSEIAGGGKPKKPAGAKPKKRIRPKKKPASQERDSGPKGMSDNEREEFTDLDSGGKDKYTGARNHGYDHESAMDYAEGVEGNQVERDAELDPDTDFARAVGEGKLREWTESRDKDSGKDKGDKPKFERDEENQMYKPIKAEDFSIEAVSEELSSISKEGREDGAGTLEDPIYVGKDVELAHQLLSEGKHIRMESHLELALLMDKINEIADDAKKKGVDAPEYDFCQVSVPGTNLFCTESKGVPRTKMPQFKGDPHEGSFASTRVGDKGEANIEPEFRELLTSMGISTEVKKIPASELKATQENLDGVKVSGMMRAIENGEMPQHVLDSPIFVTSDGYIVDGHHRWAALVALDVKDGVQGDIDIPVEVIDGDIGYVLDIANGFADIGGIKRKGLGAAAEGVKRLPLNPDGTLCLPCMASWK